MKCQKLLSRANRILAEINPIINVSRDKTTRLRDNVALNYNVARPFGVE